MKTNLFKVFNITAIILFVSAIFVQAQPASNNNASKTQEVIETEAKIKQITESAGISFKEGLFALEKNRSQAREKFDKSVEVFLTSGVNVRSNVKLQSCYSQLLETVYRIEFPSNQQSQVVRDQLNSLAKTCGWNIDTQLTNAVAAQISQPTPKATVENDTENKDAVAAVVPLVGFSEQKFEASPLDELAKLELTPEEQQVENNPIAEQQLEGARVAVANRSLGFSFQVHPMIQQFINYYRGRGRSTMETGLYRSGMFMRMARRIFREQGIPENVAWLGQVESAWKPSAMSWASASGLWQFIPGTGARYGLRRTAYVDERNSFERATEASAKYLKFLANRYNGNWELAMAAYNSGEGNVDRAIRRAGVANFWVAYPYLPQETRNYVPNILATILIANNPQSYGFGHVRPAPELRYEMIRVPSSTGLGLVAQAADTSVEYLRYLNPELRSNMTPPEPYVIRVPAGKVNDVYAVLKRVPGGRSNNVAVTSVLAGESAQSLANRTGMTIEQLQAANGGVIPKKGKVVVESNKVKRTAIQQPAQTSVAPATGGVRIVKAQSGDTVAKLALRNGASPVEVAKFNGLLPDSALAAGREIRIPGR